MQSPSSPARERIATWFRWQSGWCADIGSPLYAGLLDRAAEDVGAGGPIAEVTEGHGDDPPESMLALRLMGAVHRLVLTGRAPDLAAFYPSAGGSDSGAPWPAFHGAVAEHRDELRRLIEHGVQTNEVGRAAALVGGFLQVAAETGLPLRILEAGASAGLLLRWDRYLYEARGQKWGPNDSPVRLCEYNSDGPLPFDVAAHVVERVGCDRSPIDASSEDGRLTLLSYVWADQVHRIRLLKSALGVAAAMPVPIQEADAAEWVVGRVHELPQGVATVVYHSIVLQYLSAEQRSGFINAIEDAGSRATERSPLAWLRFEPGGDVAETRLKMWPGGHDRLIATSGYHGASVRWLI